MADKKKQWTSLSEPYKSKVLHELVSCAAPHCHQPEDFQQLFHRFLQRIAREYPNLSQACSNLQTTASALKCVESLGALREERASEGPFHKPSITINKLDNALVQSVQDRTVLGQYGYNLTKKHYGTVYRKEAVLRKDVPEKVNLGGRPSIVTDEKKVELVRQVLEEHTIDSERVVITGRGTKRRMVIAKHLTKRKHRLWTEVESLHKALSWSTFQRLVRLHFPHVRNPRRNTDVCYHCKTFDKDILPAALKLTEAIRSDISKLLPVYFEDFHSQAVKLGCSKDKEEVKYLELLEAFLKQKESNSSQDPMRTSLSRSSRITLHSLEASGIHKLKPHVELVRAYEWHKVSARRQGNFLKKMREGGLPFDTLMMQVDFKENVKYPMGPDETSEEWHAQNKLSLTVFGANVLAPKCLGLI